MTVSKNIDRRQFCKGAAAATAAFGALSLAGCAEGNLTETGEAAGSAEAFVANEEGAEWIAAPCWHNCGGRCLNKVLVKDGVVLRQKTDDTHEDSWDWPQSRGCLRGRSTQQQVFGADRLKYPMKRKHWEPLTGGDKSLRGRDEWVRISWDEALDAIAAELKNAKEKYGNRSILYLNIVNMEGYLGGVLGAFGGYVDSCTSGSTGTFAYKTSLFGVSSCDLNDRYDILNSDYVILWGNNVSWCAFGNPSYYLKHFKEAGVKFLFVGPEYSVTAGLTNAEWIPVRPGTDTALLLAIAHAMITRDQNGSLIDWDFLNRCTVGFDADHMPADAKTDENFRDYVMGKYDGVEKTPEWASEICGTPVEMINHLADVLGCKNNCYISSNGAPARNKGAENYPQALMTIAAMGGHFGKPGNACGDDQYYGALNRGPQIVKPAFGGTPFQFTNKFNPVDDIFGADEIWSAVLDGKYHCFGHIIGGAFHECEEREIDIHVIVSEHHNRLQTFENMSLGIEAYRKVDFVCSQAYTMKTDTRYSDIVLPICTRWEYDKDAVYDTNIDKENCFAHKKIVDPLFESRTDWEVAKELSKRLGLEWNEIVPFTDKQMWMNAMAKTTVMNEDGKYEPLLTIKQEDFDRYEVSGTPQEGRIPLEKFLDDGVYRVKRSADDPYVFISFEEFRKDPEANPLKTTASGKFEIYCQAKGDMFAMINRGVDRFEEISPLPKYIEQHEGYVDSFTDWEKKVRGPYPIQMTHVHYLRRAHSDYDNLPWLREAMPNPVFINKDDAEARGIKNGDVILVRNDVGSFIRPATVSRTIMPGVIMVPHGAGVRIDEESGIDMAGADNILTSSGRTTSSGLSGWNTTLVEYEKYTGNIELLPDCEWPLEIPLSDEE
ncbi:molybdopterin-dependent oxidoreductase [Gordonibacter massiliensis (ex Traore et al. 2017)]|uniref:molybdopterin-dependent oxidoreductase n=1 Tax=Gordonibacter massiliensis (ex Traore et al. 2017) TaxID=1841863 RepID=UPI001C8C9D83|nr:molybdopterin-dependent oxidoreductase [Gordonibacter massiliensis (ex Traore et al. 2017)]